MRRSLDFTGRGDVIAQKGGGGSRKRRKESVEHKNVSPDGSNLRAVLEDGRGRWKTVRSACNWHVIAPMFFGGESTQSHHSFFPFFFFSLFYFLEYARPKSLWTFPSKLYTEYTPSTLVVKKKKLNIMRQRYKVCVCGPIWNTTVSNWTKDPLDGSSYDLSSKRFLFNLVGCVISLQ